MHDIPERYWRFYPRIEKIGFSTRDELIVKPIILFLENKLLNILTQNKMALLSLIT